jgi:hypothetical protein
MVIKKTQTELILREEKEKLNVLRTILTSLSFQIFFFHVLKENVQ